MVKCALSQWNNLLFAQKIILHGKHLTGQAEYAENINESEERNTESGKKSCHKGGE